MRRRQWATRARRNDGAGFRGPCRFAVVQGVLQRVFHTLQVSQFEADLGQSVSGQFSYRAAVGAVGEF